MTKTPAPREPGDRLVAAWLRDHGEAMRVAARRWRGRAVTEDDIVLEALAIAVGIAGRAPSGATKTRAWLVRIVRNVGMRHRTKRQRRARLMPSAAAEFEAWLGEPHTELDTWLGKLDSDSRRDKVLDAASCLSPRLREVVELVVLEGMTDREIADALGMKAAAVRQARNRAVARLRHIIWGGGGAPPPNRPT